MKKYGVFESCVVGLIWNWSTPFCLIIEGESIMALMSKRRNGNLTLSTATLGARIRCVCLFDVRQYGEYFRLQAFNLPALLEVYRIRANVQGGRVLLVEIKNPQVRYSQMKGGELAFPYNLFDILS